MSWVLMMASSRLVFARAIGGKLVSCATNVNPLRGCETSAMFARRAGKDNDGRRCGRRRRVGNAPGPWRGDAQARGVPPLPAQCGGEPGLAGALARLCAALR